MSFKIYRGVLILLILAFFLILLAVYINFKIPKKKILTLSKEVVFVTRLASFSFGSFWFEPRERRFQPHCYPIYPELPSADRLNFIYSLKDSFKNAN
jgi:energy-coupling factor transporter transmembrane protein EcfT